MLDLYDDTFIVLSLVMTACRKIIKYSKTFFYLLVILYLNCRLNLMLFNFLTSGTLTNIIVVTSVNLVNLI